MGKMEGLGISIAGAAAAVAVMSLVVHCLHLLAPATIPDIDGSRRMSASQFASSQSSVCSIFTPTDFAEVVLHEDPSVLGGTDSDDKDGDLYVSGGDPHDNSVPKNDGCNYHYVYYTATGDIQEAEVQLVLTCNGASGKSLHADVNLSSQGWDGVKQSDVYNAVLSRFEDKAAAVKCPT